MPTKLFTLPTVNWAITFKHIPENPLEELYYRQPPIGRSQGRYIEDTSLTRVSISFSDRNNSALR